MAIDRITSFTIDHDILVPGFYISRIDGDITTYDMRTRKPNNGDYMDNATMHSLEHMFATYIRNSSLRDDIIYFGPMGCQTGFYLLVRNASHPVVFNIVIHVLQQIIEHTGEVFGAERKECGNYANLTLEAAITEASSYLEVLLNPATPRFDYPEAEL